MNLKVSFRRARKKQGRAPFCVDTRAMLGKAGQQHFFETKEKAQHYIDTSFKEWVNADNDSYTWTFADLKVFYGNRLENECRSGERSLSNLDEITRHINQFCACTVSGKRVDDMLVRELTKGHIELDMIDQLRVNRAKKTIINLMGSVNGMMKFAASAGCRETNPCFQVTKKGDPAKTKRKTKAARIHPDIIRKIIAAMPGDWQLITNFACNIGLRQGELRALTWADILWDNNQVNINKAYKHRAGVGEPKTEAGTRRVPLPKGLKKALQEFYISRGRPSDEALVFPHVPQEQGPRLIANQYGTFETKVYKLSKVPGQPGSNKLGSALTNTHFRTAIWRACEDAGVEQITWHDLRHFAASMLLKKHSNDMWEVSKRLGHEQKSTTENVYGHFIQDEVAEEEDDLLALG